MDKQELIDVFSRAVIDGEAAVFAGAGLSRASGFVEWKDLVRDLANHINLDVDKEKDFISIAQYYKNETCSRYGINQTIMEHFSKDVVPNENVNILTELPIYTYWTTNYDKLLEDGLKSHNRCPDVKIKTNQLTIAKHGRDAIVYKMHGDVANPAEAVLTREDYESYDEHYPLFRTVLQGDLISKTFLFIGFSFSDPNLEFVLSRVASITQENRRSHYCFTKNVQRSECVDDSEYEYSKNLQELRIKDLMRYGIQSVLIDDYSEITDVLKEIRKKVYMKNIFIGAAVSEFRDPWTENMANDLAYSLSYELVRNGNSIISGFGKGIGSSVIRGAVQAVEEDVDKHLDDYLKVKPFPQNIEDDYLRQKEFTKYREGMLSNVGICIFMFGNKIEDGKVVPSSGMMEEFNIAKNSNKIIIPIGSTGDVAQSIWEEIDKNMVSYKYLRPYMDRLRTVTDVNEIKDLILEILKTL